MRMQFIDQVVTTSVTLGETHHNLFLNPTIFLCSTTIIIVTIYALAYKNPTALGFYGYLLSKIKK